MLHKYSSCEPMPLLFCIVNRRNYFCIEDGEREENQSEKWKIKKELENGDDICKECYCFDVISSSTNIHIQTKSRQMFKEPQNKKKRSEQWNG